MPLLKILRVLLGLLFVGAGLTKLVPPDNRLLFEMSVSAHGLLPAAAVVWVGWALPLFEIALGALLVAGWRPRLVAPVTAALLAVFMSVNTTAYFTGIQADCGCFGFGEPISVWTLARTLTLFLVAVAITAGAWLRRAPRAAEPQRVASEPRPRLVGEPG